MKKRVFLYILSALALAFIWGNSFLGAGSYKLSGAINSLLGMNELVLRKLAHFTEYAGLGFLLSLALKNTKHRISIVLISGLAVAVIDELIQTLSIYRHASLFDVLIDASGVFAGICTCWIVGKIINKTSGKK